MVLCAGFLEPRFFDFLRLKKGALSCLKGFIREPKPPKRGTRVLLGILAYRKNWRYL